MIIMYIAFICIGAKTKASLEASQAAFSSRETILYINPKRGQIPAILLLSPYSLRFGECLLHIINCNQLSSKKVPNLQQQPNISKNDNSTYEKKYPC